MPHTYIVSSLINNGGNFTLVGSVDNIGVGVLLGKTTFANALAFEQYVQPIMLNEAFPPAPTTTVILATSFTS